MLVLSLSALAGDRDVVIRGRVLDDAARSPLANATVTLRQAGLPGPLASGSTNARGEFAFAVKTDALRFSLKAELSGYVQVSVNQTPSTLTFVRLEASQHEATADVRLVRTAQIRARLTDADRRRPIAGLTVLAMRREVLSGETVFFNRGSAISNRDGEIVFPDVEPGAYQLLVQPERGPTVVETKPGDEPDAEARPLYALQYWPSLTPEGRPWSVANATPGGILDGGTIPLQRVASRTVQFRYRAECGKNGRLDVTVAVYDAVSSRSIAHGLVDCGEFTIRDITDGSYQLELVHIGANGTVAGFQAMPLEVRRSGIEDVEPRAPARLTGKIELAGSLDEALPDRLQTVAIRLSAGGRPTLGVEGGSKRVAPDGTFEATIIPGSAYAIHLDSLAAGYYIKRIIYNGQTVADRFGWKSTVSGAGHRMVITVADHAPTLRGRLSGLRGNWWLCSCGMCKTRSHGFKV